MAKPCPKCGADPSRIWAAGGQARCSACGEYTPTSELLERSARQLDERGRKPQGPADVLDWCDELDATGRNMLAHADRLGEYFPELAEAQRSAALQVCGASAKLRRRCDDVIGTPSAGFVELLGGTAHPNVRDQTGYDRMLSEGELAAARAHALGEVTEQEGREITWLHENGDTLACPFHESPQFDNAPPCALHQVSEAVLQIARVVVSHGITIAIVACDRPGHVALSVDGQLSPATMCETLELLVQRLRAAQKRRGT